jgi:hypothetical protein
MVYHQPPLFGIAGIVPLLIAGMSGIVGAAPSATQPTTVPATRTSQWGQAVSGLQARVEAPVEVEQGAALPVTIELQWDPDSVPKGDAGLNTFMYPAHLQLRMVNIAATKTFAVEPYDPTSGMPCPDEGRDVVALDVKSSTRLQAEFPLRLAGPDLQPGDYDCTVSYSTDRRGNVQPPSGAVHYWSGEIVSAPLRLKVVAEVPRSQTFSLPTRLRVDADGYVRFHPDDAESVRLVVGNGMFVGARISNSDNTRMSMQSGTPQMDGANTFVDDLRKLPAGRTRSYTIEVFETSDQPHHMWFAEGRKTLWKKTFSVTTAAAVK